MVGALGRAYRNVRERYHGSRSLKYWGMVRRGNLRYTARAPVGTRMGCRKKSRYIVGSHVDARVRPSGDMGLPASALAKIK